MKRWQERFATVLQEMEHGDRPASLSLPAISMLVKAPSNFDLSAQAAEFAKEGRLRIAYRLLSPVTGAEIGRFEHFHEIPKVAYDDTSDEPVSVVPNRDVEIVYQVPSAS